MTNNLSDLINTDEGFNTVFNMLFDKLYNVDESDNISEIREKN